MAKWCLGDEYFWTTGKHQSNNPCLSKVIHHVYIDNWVGGDLDYYMIYIADQQPVHGPYQSWPLNQLTASRTKPAQEKCD